jgi:hypothetical protein
MKGVGSHITKTPDPFSFPSLVIDAVQTNQHSMARRPQCSGREKKRKGVGSLLLNKDSRPLFLVDEAAGVRIVESRLIKIEVGREVPAPAGKRKGSRQIGLVIVVLLEDDGHARLIVHGIEMAKRVVLAVFDDRLIRAHQTVNAAQVIRGRPQGVAHVEETCPHCVWRNGHCLASIQRFSTEHFRPLFFSRSLFFSTSNTVLRSGEIRWTTTDSYEVIPLPVHATSYLHLAIPFQASLQTHILVTTSAGRYPTP